MNTLSRRNRLMPWYIGIVIVILGVGYLGYQMYATGCAAPAVSVFLVLLGIPIVYLVLMYLTLTSQE
jgi:hypothetical protein